VGDYEEISNGVSKYLEENIQDLDMMFKNRSSKKL
jgi:hypothetical protein